MGDRAGRVVVALGPADRALHRKPYAADARETPRRPVRPYMEKDAFDRRVEIDDALAQLRLAPIEAIPLRRGARPQIGQVRRDPLGEPGGGHLNFQIEALVAFVRTHRETFSSEDFAGVDLRREAM